MCELLGISRSGPTGAGVILRAFQQRGGEAADNPDGWGIAAHGRLVGRVMTRQAAEPAVAANHHSLNAA